MRLLTSHGIKVRVAPPYWQSQNGLVESHWKYTVSMAGVFLTKARLPKKLWYWTLREAVHRLNLMPVKHGMEMYPLHISYTMGANPTIGYYLNLEPVDSSDIPGISSG